MKSKIRNLALHSGESKQLQTPLNRPQKEKRPNHQQNESMPLNKKQVQHQLEVEGEDDLKDPNYDPETDPTPVVIFDSELPYIQELKAVDIIFLLDTTGSMNPYMKGIKRLIRKILWDAQKCLTQYLLDEIDVLKVGLVCYKDHDQVQKTYVSQIVSNLTSDFKEFTELLMNVKVNGGKDIPEAVLDGLNDCVYNINWRDKSYKFIYHILDSPPHGKLFYNGDDDLYSGCPNGFDHEDILIEMRNKDINYSIIKFGDYCDMMIQEFEKIVKIEIITPDIKPDSGKFMGQDT